jgi:glutamine---fructose-6-phosphate transaminase (isomerizing)
VTLDRAAAFAVDLAAGPAALRRLLDAWQEPGGAARLVPDLDGRPLRFCGFGSSRFAAQIVAESLADQGRPVAAGWPSPSRRVDPHEVLFAISSSGRTTEVVADARRDRAGGATVVAVTNGLDSPLADAANVTLPLVVGFETSGIACTSFRATVLTLAAATGAAEPEALSGAVRALEAALATRRPNLDDRLDLLDGAEAVDVIGDGRWIGALEQAALMLREAPRLRAAAWDTAEWLHTGVYTALPGHRAILFSDGPNDSEVVDTIRRRGGDLIMVGEANEATPIEVAIAALAEVEEIAAGLWSRVTATDRRLQT